MGPPRSANLHKAKAANTRLDSELLSLPFELAAHCLPTFWFWSKYQRGALASVGFTPRLDLVLDPWFRFEAEGGVRR